MLRKKSSIFLLRAAAALLSAVLLLGAALSVHAERMEMMGLEDPAINRDWAQNRFFVRMAERTGLEFAFRQHTDEAGYRQALSRLGEAGQPLPDVLFKAALSPAEAMVLLEKGVLIDLAPYLEDHAPHLSALLSKDPALRQGITLPDGRIAALPFIETAPAQNVLWINKTWLDQLKLDMPDDAEALEKALRAFKADDPNRNGRKDELPLSFLGAYDLKYLAHAFGLAANDYHVFVRDGQVRFMPLAEGFRPFLAWCRGLYQAGLLAKDSFATLDAFRRVTDAKATNTLGAFFAPLPSYLVPVEWAGDYAALPPLFYQGKSVYRAISQPFQTGTFAVTSACQDVAAALNWVDQLYTPEGAILASIGLEGEDYVVDGDGSWRSLPGISDAQYQANAVIATGTAMPGLSSDAFQRRYTDPLVDQLSKQVDVVAAVAKSPFPPFSLSHEEAEAIAPLQAALGRYVDESIARFVLGEWELSDARHEAFEAELQALGLPDFLAFWQKIYDRGEEIQ